MMRSRRRGAGSRARRRSRWWRRAGFAVHVLAFDWRQRLDAAADQLHHALARRGPVVLVAHGSAALVACLYAQRHRSWHDRVLRAIFLAPPLRGSFAAVALAL